MRFILFIYLCLSLKGEAQIPPTTLPKGRLLTHFEIRLLDESQEFNKWADSDRISNSISTIQEMVAWLYRYNNQRVISNDSSKLHKSIHSKFYGFSYELLLKEFETHLKFKTIVDTLIEQEEWLVTRGKTIKVDTIAANRFLGGGITYENYTSGNDLICSECSIEQLALLIEQFCGTCFVKHDTNINFMYYNKFRLPEKVLRGNFDTLNNYLIENTGFFLIKRKEKIPMIYIKFR
jgi:hypothetical protein